MIVIRRVSVFLFLFFGLSCSVLAQGDFVMEWEVKSRDVVTLPVVDVEFSHYTDGYSIDWGDGTLDGGFDYGGDIEHEYDTGGTKTIKIIGSEFPGLKLEKSEDELKAKLTKITNWGSAEWVKMDGAFSGCINLVVDAPDYPKIKAIINCSAMFRDIAAFNNDLGGWDIEKIVDMAGMLDSVTLSSDNYDETLRKWEENPKKPSDITFGAGNSKLCSGKEYKYILASNGWTINDGGSVIEDGPKKKMDLVTCGDGSNTTLYLNDALAPLGALESVAWYEAYEGGTQLASNPEYSSISSIGKSFYAELVKDGCVSGKRTEVFCKIMANPPSPAVLLGDDNYLAECEQTPFVGLDPIALIDTSNFKSYTKMLWYEKRRGGEPIENYVLDTIGSRAYYGELVEGDCASEERILVRIEILKGPPQVNIAMDKDVVCTGEDVTLSLVEELNGEVNYQWRKNTNNIRNATESTYTLKAIREKDLGSYSVVISLGSAECSRISRKRDVKFSEVFVRKFDRVILVDNKDSLFTGYQWMKDGEVLVGETKQFFKEPEGVDLDGVYNVELTLNDGTKVLACDTTFISRSSQLKKTNMLLYPNPVARGAYVNVKLDVDDDFDGKSNLFIYNISGELAVKLAVKNKEILFDTSGLKEGLYLIYYGRNKKNILVQKMMIK